MFWLKDLLPMAAGFIKGFVSEYRSSPAHGTSPGPAYDASTADSSDFQSRIVAFGQAMGLGQAMFRGRTVAFDVPVQGVPYLVGLTPGQYLVMASTPSKVEFPHGIPRGLKATVERLNAGMTSGCKYQVIYDESCFYATMNCGLHELSLPVFQGMLVELTSRIVALDRMLVENGYGQ